MAAPRAGSSAAGGLAASAVASPLSWFVDACLVVLLAAIPLIAHSADQASVIVMAGAALLGAWSLYQKASRAQRQSRCAWTVFIALSVSIHMGFRLGFHLGFRAIDAGVLPSGIPSGAAQVAGLAAVLALAGRLGITLRARRRPRLEDAYDQAVALCLGIFAVSAAAFALVGEGRGARALLEPAVIAAMLLVARGQCASAGKARGLAQLGMVSAILGILVWGVTR